MKNKKEIKIKEDEIEFKLYKPIEEFKWKDATKEEIEKESIPHYSKKFPL